VHDTSLPSGVGSGHRMLPGGGDRCGVACAGSREQLISRSLETDQVHRWSKGDFPTKRSVVEDGVEERVTFNMTLERHLLMAHDAGSWGIAITNSTEGRRLVTSCMHAVIGFLFPLNKR